LFEKHLGSPVDLASDGNGFAFEANALPRAVEEVPHKRGELPKIFTDVADPPGIRTGLCVDLMLTGRFPFTAGFSQTCPRKNYLRLRACLETS
jgi:hypothetical protein